MPIIISATTQNEPVEINIDNIAFYIPHEYGTLIQFIGCSNNPITRIIDQPMDWLRGKIKQNT